MEAANWEIPDVKVNVRNAVCNLAAILYAKQNCVTIPFDDLGLVETTDFFRCKDGRWVYIVCSLPHLRQLACAVLGCQATREEFVDRCMRWNGALLEEAMNADLGGGYTAYIGQDQADKGVYPANAFSIIEEDTQGTGGS